MQKAFPQISLNYNLKRLSNAFYAQISYFINLQKLFTGLIDFCIALNFLVKSVDFGK